MSKKTSRVLLCLAVVGPACVQAVTLQNATATFSQNFNGSWTPDEMIDGIDNVSTNGWAIFSQAAGTSAQTAVFETALNLSAAGLRIDMSQKYAANPGHLLGRFRWSATTDDRSTFADGLFNGGDVSANWTVLNPISITTPAGTSGAILGDGSILVSGSASTGNYLVDLNLGLSNITGLRLEVMEDPSLPTGGPGKFSNGNFVVTELRVETLVPEPATMLALAVGAVGMARARRKSARV